MYKAKSLMTQEEIIADIKQYIIETYPHIPEFGTWALPYGVKRYTELVEDWHTKKGRDIFMEELWPQIVKDPQIVSDSKTID